MYVCRKVYLYNMHKLVSGLYVEVFNYGLMYTG